MARAKVTSKGQVTIPKLVRDSLHLHSGDCVEFVVRNDSEAVLKPINKSVDEVFGKLHDPDTPAKTIEQMDAAVRKRFGSNDS